MVKIGIIGCGGIANGKHITELLKIGECQITALCDPDENALSRTAERLHLSADQCYKDYKMLIDHADVDAVEICTPNHMHIPIAEYAVAKGKAINVEKPLALTAAETCQLARSLSENPVPNMMCFSYRFYPAVRYAKYLLEKGSIGKIVSVDVAYLKSSAFWEGRRLDWRFVKKYAGTGVLGDLGVHLIDMTQLLVGDIVSVSAMTGIVVKKRQRLDSDEYADVETDDYCNFIANVRDPQSDECIPANFVITRCAIGHQNTIRFDIFGTEGFLSFDLNHPDELTVCIGEVDRDCGGQHKVKVPAKYTVSQEQMFVDHVSGKACRYLPSIADGIKCQKVLDAILESANTRTFVSVDPDK